MYVSILTHIYICVCVCVCVYTHTERERAHLKLHPETNILPMNEKENALLQNV